MGLDNILEQVEVIFSNKRSLKKWLEDRELDVYAKDDTWSQIQLAVDIFVRRAYKAGKNEESLYKVTS